MKKILFSFVWLFVTANALTAQPTGLSKQQPIDLKSQDGDSEKKGELLEIQRLKDLESFSNDVVRNAPIVFEGRVRQAEQYFNGDSSHIYHATYIEVLRVVKGQEYIKTGTIELRSDLLPELQNKNFISHILEYKLPVPQIYPCFRDMEYDTLTSGRVHLFFCKAIQNIPPHFEKVSNKVLLEDYKSINRNYGQEHSSIDYPYGNIAMPFYFGFGNLLREKDYESLSYYLMTYGLKLDKDTRIR
jgi:hypothetical protein